MHQWRMQDFQEEGTSTSKVERQHIILANFLQKRHENEKIEPKGEGARLWSITSSPETLDPPMYIAVLSLCEPFSFFHALTLIEWLFNKNS